MHVRNSHSSPNHIWSYSMVASLGGFRLHHFGINGLHAIYVWPGSIGSAQKNPSSCEFGFGSVFSKTAIHNKKSSSPAWLRTSVSSSFVSAKGWDMNTNANFEAHRYTIATLATALPTQFRLRTISFTVKGIMTIGIMLFLMRTKSKKCESKQTLMNAFKISFDCIVRCQRNVHDVTLTRKFTALHCQSNAAPPRHLNHASFQRVKSWATLSSSWYYSKFLCNNNKEIQLVSTVILDIPTFICLARQTFHPSAQNHYSVGTSYWYNIVSMRTPILTWLIQPLRRRGFQKPSNLL